MLKETIRENIVEKKTELEIGCVMCGKNDQIVSFLKCLRVLMSVKRLNLVGAIVFS